MFNPVRFSKEAQFDFFAKLKQRVDNHFEQNDLSKKGNHMMILKTVIMFSLVFVPYFLILTETVPLWGALLLCLVIGVGVTGIGFGVMHDANHDAYSKYPWLNNLMGYSMNLIGGSSFTWKMQHNILHHTYTNVYELDEDVHDKPILRLSPYGKWQPIHRFQAYYATFLYMLATISWVTKKDFSQMNRYNREGLTERFGFNPRNELIVMIVSKLFYFFYMMVIPLLVMDITFWQWLLGFFVIHATSGLIMTLVFQLAHVVEGVSHHKPVEVGTMENTWAVHQLLSTANFASKSKVVGWFVGGLNFQVEHHLFPAINHRHYPAIAKIVRKTADECELPYHDKGSLWSALVSHYKVLDKMGRKEYETSLQHLKA